jgi:hypothetical protein
MFFFTGVPVPCTYPIRESQKFSEVHRNCKITASMSLSVKNVLRDSNYERPTGSTTFYINYNWINQNMW